MNTNVKEVIREEPKVACQFCHTSMVNALEWGPLYQLDGITVHHFCLLFTAGLSQNGKDDEGIMGFLPADILKEIKRGNKLKCKYCRKPNATIGCSVPKCKTSFHYPCGLKNECGFQFIENYEAYCPKHKKKNGIPQEVNLELDHCPICSCDISKEDSDAIWPPCCRMGVLLHKSCMMEMGRNHGLNYFKCPLCNDQNTFSVAMRKLGIYLPNRDATWEAEPGAFEEQYEQYERCDAEKCSCPQGRDHSSNTESEPWTIIRCEDCGASAIHKFCGKVKNLTWSCVTCAEILTNKRKSRKRNTARIQPPHHETFSTSSDEQEGLSSNGFEEGEKDIDCKYPCTVNLIRCDDMIQTYVQPTTYAGVGTEATSRESVKSGNSRLKSVERNAEGSENNLAVVKPPSQNTGMEDKEHKNTNNKDNMDADRPSQNQHREANKDLRNVHEKLDPAEIVELLESFDDSDEEEGSPERENTACKFRRCTVNLTRCDDLIPIYLTPPTDTMVGNNENLGGDCEKSSNSRAKSMGRNAEAENNSPGKRKRRSSPVKIPKCRYEWQFKNLKKRPKIIPAVKTTAEIDPGSENNLAEVVPPSQNQAEAGLLSEAQNRTEEDNEHEDQKIFRCPFCFVTFMGPALLIAHLPNHSADLDKLRNTVSPNDQTHSEKEVNAKDLRTNHDDSDAMDDASLLNPIMPKKLSPRVAKTKGIKPDKVKQKPEYMKLGSEEGRPFKCVRCNFTFTTIQSLRIHECCLQKSQSCKYSTVILRPWENHP